MRIYIILILLMIPLAIALEECQRVQEPADIPCSVISSWRPSDCTDYNLTIFNESDQGILNLTWGNQTTKCNFTFNFTDQQTYTYNSSLDTGIIVVKGGEEMIWSVIFFLLTINIVLFGIPFWVKRLHPAESTNYVFKRLIWIASMLFLWFNTTILRTLAVRQGLGIDDQLIVYWWFFTMGVFICIFAMVYFGLVGLLKILKEVEMKKRMGFDESEGYNQS